MATSVVSVLAIGPKVCRFKPSQGNGFLRVIKVSSMPSFGDKVKLSASRHKISWNVNNHFKVCKILQRLDSSFP
jgi:hypothetical protein